LIELDKASGPTKFETRFEQPRFIRYETGAQEAVASWARDIRSFVVWPRRVERDTARLYAEADELLWSGRAIEADGRACRQMITAGARFALCGLVFCETESAK
jgi:hypothetical protein